MPRGEVLIEQAANAVSTVNGVDVPPTMTPYPAAHTCPLTCPTAMLTPGT
ncbi:hypothetical protein AB0B10_06980 [Micromonospora arborensis]